MKQPRFPLPVDHSRAPVTFNRGEALLLLALIFGCGVFVGFVASCVCVIAT